MGEVVVLSSEEEMDVGQLKKKGKKDDRSDEVVVNLENILPKMALRVLLVEADDSTRQIITALLRKCSYRVAAVSDGLMAWETLRRKASDIDLILTEVELPSISGFALLTLITEHDICKNIPVIMMSSHDSTSMVWKCMLRGAVDFLMKPVRKNELRNLWQHVWRRRAISGHPQYLSSSQKKLEAASENKASSNNSSGSVASAQDNNGCSEKGSEAQGPSWQKGTSSSSLSNDRLKYEVAMKSERRLVKQNNESGEKPILETAMCNKTIKSTGMRLEQSHDYAKIDTRDGTLTVELSRDNPSNNSEIHSWDNELGKPSREAIDLIATFDNLPSNSDENSSLIHGGTNKFDLDPQLELSLRRDISSGACRQATEERQTLNHSNASAFSWYRGDKLLQLLFPSPSSNSAEENPTAWHYHESDKLSGNITHDSSRGGYTKAINQSQENMTSLVSGQSGQVALEIQLPNGQHGGSPDTRVMRDYMSSGRGHVYPSMFSKQYDVHSIWSTYQKENSPLPTSTSYQSNTGSHSSEQHFHWSDDAINSSLDQTVPDTSNLDPARRTSVDVQSTSNSLCHDAANHINSIVAYGSMESGSDGNATSTIIVENMPDGFIDAGHQNYDGFRGIDSHCASQREAALAKFRLKRKDRCFEKKVRYQSRKRLAEQRPRVKGQFVRQVHNDHPVADAFGGS